MNAMLFRSLAAVMAIGLLLAAPVSAEVNVSLTITGSMDEIMAIVQTLKNMGYGGGIDANDPLKLRVQSTHNVQPESIAQTPAAPAAPAADPAVPTPAQTSVPAPAQAPAPAPAPEPKPVIALNNAAVKPASLSPGQPVLIMVEVIDLQNAIDTLAASLINTKVSVDLHDNGTNGDAVAGDGVWSASLTLPADLPAGPHDIGITAYDGNGTVIQTLTKDQRVVPLNAKTQVTVTK